MGLKDGVFQTPILLIVFNRFNEAKLVFEAIRFQKPTQLFISSDGARSEEENLKVQEIRNYLVEHVDWECELKTKFNDANLGCNIGPSSAITWFFSQVKKGIILEDDCVPDKSFFSYCEKYLDIFEYDKTVWHIAGNNLLGEYQNYEIDQNIIFSNFNFIWGWATWSNRWSSYDSELTTFNSTDFIDKIFTNKKDQEFWKSVFYRVKNKELTTCWDYQWTFVCWRNSGISIVPKKNLVKNIGFDSNATHTQTPNPFIENIKVHSFIFNGISNSKLDKNFDQIVQRKFFRLNLWVRIVLKFSKIIKGYKK
jgi:hypothetical protein